MDAFQQALEVEAEGICNVVKYLRARKDVEAVAYLPAKRIIQKQFGDLIVNMTGGNRFSVEVKVDLRGWTTNNLFLEEWSNINTPKTQGWMQYCQADYLMYYLKNREEIYTMPFDELRRWAYNTAKTKDIGMFKFESKTQKKYYQKNVSVGYCVPTWKLQSFSWCKTIKI